MAARLSLRAAAVCFAVLCAFVAKASADDVCKFGAGGVYNYQTIMTCFQSVPFSEKVRSNTIESLMKAYELFTFLDIAAAPPATGLDVIPVDLMKELKDLQVTSYSSDFAFQTDLTRIYRRFQDAHTRYMLPQCYRSVIFWQPVSLLTYTESVHKQQIVAVSPSVTDPSIVDLYRKEHGVDLMTLANAQVLQIDGRDALETLVDFARTEVGISKDAGTRLNLAVSQVEPSPTSPEGAQAEIDGAWQRRGGDFSPFPSAPSVSYRFSLTNGTVVEHTFPWLGTFTRDFANTTAFMAAYWASRPTPSPAQDSELLQSSQPRSPLTQLKQEDQLEEFFRQNRRVREPSVSPFKAASPAAGAPPSQFELLVQDGHVHAYRIVNDSRTMVLYIDTFAPENTASFQKTVEEALNKGAALGLDRLVLDLTQNGGGDICLGLKLLAYLFPNDPYPFPPTDMPQSDLAVAMAKNAVTFNVTGDTWSPDSYTAYRGKDFTDASWLIPGITFTRGGRTRGYSQLLHLSDKACSYDPVFPGPAPKAPAEVLIVSHGFCGSTCALFANHAAQYDNIKTVVVGGINGKPMQYTSFPGLQVLDTPALWDSIESYFPQDKATNPLVPPRLLTSARYRFCIREIYPSPLPNIPTEYAFQQADYHLDNTLETILHPELIWLNVRQYFTK